MDHPPGIRPLVTQDLAALLSLERATWEPKGIESLPETTAAKWLENGVCLGHFKSNGLNGYVYGEVISFKPVPPYSTELATAIQSYKDTRCAHKGNTLHGLSMAVTRPGVGGPLLEAMVREARRRRLEYFVSLARLEGLGRFVQENEKIVRDLDLEVVAALYAIQAVSWISPALVGEPLSLMAIPEAFPSIRRKDLVVSRFARIGKKLWGVARTSFPDSQSLGFSALLVLPL